MSINGNVTFAFNKIPQGRHIAFSLDMLIATATPPTITLDSRVINPPTLPTLTNGLRVVLKFEGVRDDTSTRFTYLGGTIDSGGGTGISFPIDFPENNRGTVGASTQNIVFSASTRHSVKMTVSGDVNLAFISPPTNETAYTNIIILQDGTGGHTVTLPAGTINKDIVDAGILTDANEETGIVIKFAFGTFYAFLETGNIVTGGAEGYKTIQDEGVSLTQQSTLNFIGANVTAVNNAGQNRTDVTISGAFALNDLTDVSTGGAVSGQSLIFNGSLWTSANVLLSNVTIDADKSFAGKSISDVLSLGSNAIFVPGSGFIRMGTAEEIRMRNPTNTDDLIITSGNDTLGRQSIIFKVASGNQMTISELDIDVLNNDITNTGDIEVGSGVHSVGLLSAPYNQIFSNFFVPVGATIIINRFGFARTSDKLYVNYSNTGSSAGFGIFEQGVESFTFSQPSSNVHQLFIGPQPFTSGEEYRIQMGENSNASGRIYFIEGVGNDVIIDRAGGGPDQGVQIRANNLTKARFLSNKIQIFQPLDANAKDLINVVDIKSNGNGASGTGEIGELITADGGFNYFMRDRITWEANANIYLQFTVNDINVSSDTGLVNFIKVDPDPSAGDNVAILNFRLFDSPETDTYASIQTVAVSILNNSALVFNVRANNGLLSGMTVQGDDNNQRIQLIIGGTTGSRVQPFLGVMGYFVTPKVTDFSLNIGTGGSLEIPTIANSSPSVTNLNQAFGAFDNAIGYESIDERLYVRESATRWVFFAASGVVT